MSSCCSRLQAATAQTAQTASCNGSMRIRLFFSSEGKKKANTRSVITKSLPFESKQTSNKKENYLPGKRVVNTGVATAECGTRVACFSFWIFFLSFHFCISCVWMFCLHAYLCTHVCLMLKEARRGPQIPCNLELQAGMSCIWVLGTEPGSS